MTLRDVKPEFISAGAWNQVQPYYWYFPTVNDHLRAAVARHPNLSLIDWAAIADRPGLTYDAIHLNTVGASEYAANIARVVMSAASRLPAGSTTTVKVAGVGGVPAAATAVSLNLTVTNPRSPGFLTTYPCDEPRPLASNVNFTSDNTVAGAAIVPVAADGTICVFTNAATHLVVDVMGSFSGADAYIRAGPTRLADTRNLGDAGLIAHNPLRVQLPAAIAGAAAVLNVTAVSGQRAGFVTVYRCGDPVPGTSNLNFPASGIVPNLVIAQADSTGGVCLFANQPTHLVVDLFGGLATSAVSLHTPLRAIDTARQRWPAAGAIGGDRDHRRAARHDRRGAQHHDHATRQLGLPDRLSVRCADAADLEPQRRTATDSRQLRDGPTRRRGTCVRVHPIQCPGDRRCDGHDRAGVRRSGRAVASVRQSRRVIARPVHTRRAHYPAVSLLD